ncbi:phosphatidate cytidylyltransferase [Candidatus Pelagibacter sp.]|jgi:phosphatidate cytidylyltransferase|nr:phosphatidate cytidylyltransferase [Candidatus Pelagibacter sp.]
MTKNLSERILTSLLLLFILFISIFINKYLFLALLIVSSFISFNEFNKLIKKSFKKEIKYINTVQIFSALFLILFVYTSYQIYGRSPITIIWIISICIFSDTGGFVIGKLVGGKKLTKISPNKTIAGSVGSFLFALIPLIFLSLIDEIYNDVHLAQLVIVSLLLSLICQAGDLLISYFKRKAKVKDTGSILPGHGGLLDRIDGLIFVLPAAFLIDKIIF